MRLGPFAGPRKTGPEAASPQLRKRYPIETFIDRLRLGGAGEPCSAALCLCSFTPTPSIPDGMIGMLHPLELSRYDALPSGRRRKSYLLGRYAAKHAFAALTGEEDPGAVLIRNGVFDQPVLTHERARNIQVSISHSADFGAALAFPETHPMGIDIERIDPSRTGILETQATTEEKDLLRSCAVSFDAALTLLWTAKEALSKILKTGMTVPPEVLEVSVVDAGEERVMGGYRNFVQYEFVSFCVGCCICSVVLPSGTGTTVDARSIHLKFPPPIP